LTLNVYCITIAFKQQTAKRLQMLKVKVTEDSMPKNFHDAVRMLVRPYVPITASDVKQLEVVTKGYGDIVIYKGRRMTWGRADGGCALMPIRG
jgi:hypothetical protein